MIHNFFIILFIIFVSYFLILTFYYIFLTLVGFSKSRKNIFESELEDYTLLKESSFAIPLSIIIPVHNEEAFIKESVKSILNLDYPEYELIIINDGSTDHTLDILIKLLHLRPKDKSFRDEFTDGKIHEIYRSDKHRNVTVIHKSFGMKKAGAINAGLNIAKYKYVCVIDADTILEPDALLKVMAQVEKYPEDIIGIGSYFGLLNGFDIKNGKILKRSFSYNPIVAYQNLEYLRTFIGNRLSWSAFGAIPIISGGFGIWRRDIIAKLKGYDSTFTCEDLEFTFRAQDNLYKKNIKGKILSLPNYIGWTSGPGNLKALISQRERWQRVIDEAVWQYKYMIFNPKFGWFGFLTMPYYLFYETLGVFFEITSVFTVFIAYLMGILNIVLFLGFFALMVLSQSVISAMVIWVFIRDQKIFRLRYVAYLLFLSFLELFFYKWVLSIAKVKGTVNFFLRKREFNQYTHSRGDTHRSA